MEESKQKEETNYYQKEVKIENLKETKEDVDMCLNEQIDKNKNITNTVNELKIKLYDKEVQCQSYRKDITQLKKLDNLSLSELMDKLTRLNYYIQAKLNQEGMIKTDLNNNNT